MDHITSTETSECPLCGQLGVCLYESQVDRLFDAPGTWNFFRCGRVDCGLIWLNPKPVTAELWKAYKNYYTHSDSSQNPSGSLGLRIWLQVKRSYLAKRYGYASGKMPLATAFASWLLYAFPIRRSRVDGEVRFLNASPGGRLLDVGCGSGGFAEKMEGLGWHCEGVDFDLEAVTAARAKGLKVYHGTLEEQQLPTNYYDAITLNHVIEHVPSAIDTLMECKRILKPGGRLVLITPNTRSLSHRLYKADWRGLEPPRHLQIFNPSSMARMIKGSGFSHFSIKTHNAVDIWVQSRRLAALSDGASRNMLGKLRDIFGAGSLAIAEQMLLTLRPDAGECLHAIAVK